MTRADWVWGAEWGAGFLRPTFIDFNQNWLHNWGPAVADWTSFGRPSEALCYSLLALYNHGEPVVSYPHSYTSQFSSLAWEGHWGWISWICTSSFPPSARDAPWGILPSCISTSLLIGSSMAVWHRRFCRRFPKDSRVAAQQRESSGLSCCWSFGCLRA